MTREEQIELIWYQKRVDGSCLFGLHRTGHPIKKGGDIILGFRDAEGYGDIADAIAIIEYINDRLSPVTTGSGDESRRSDKGLSEST